MWYQIIDDVQYPNRWHMDTVVPANGDEWAFWCFLDPTAHIDESVWNVRIQYPGEQLNFTFSGFDVPIVDSNALEAFRSVAEKDFKSIPVKVQNVKDQFYILQVTNEVECVDEKLSVFDKWAEEDERPDKIGEYKMFAKLRIDKKKIPQGLNLFRIKGWEVAVVCSEKVKRELTNITGIKYNEVT